MPRERSPRKVSGSPREERRRPRSKGVQRSRALRAVGSRTARHLSARAAEALGIGLVVLAIIAILGLWLGAGGPFGRFLQVAVRGLVGPVGYVLPVLAGYWALLLIVGTAEQDRGRMLVGLVIAALGVVGTASVAGGNPSPGAGYHAVNGAGGVLGAAVAWPLSRVLSGYGAVVVCLGLVTLGVLVFTATPIAAVGRAVGRLFTLASRPRVPRAGTVPQEEDGPPRNGRRARSGSGASEEAPAVAP